MLRWLSEYVPALTRHGTWRSMRRARDLDRHLRYLCVQSILRHLAEGRVHTISFRLSWRNPDPGVTFSGYQFHYEWKETWREEKDRVASDSPAFDFVFHTIAWTGRADMLRIIKRVGEHARLEPGRRLVYKYRFGYGYILKR